MATTDPTLRTHEAASAAAPAPAAPGSPSGDPAIDTLSFDDALAELQRTVAELETGGQPLEAAIALYERGVALQARCERLLGDAELRVQQLVQRAGGAIDVRDLRPEDDEEPPVV